MKVIIICTEPFPNGTAATKRILCYAKALLQKKVDCSVLIYRRTKNDKKKNPDSEETYKGVHFKYVGGSTIKPANKIPRIISESLDKNALRSYLKKKLEKGDDVIGYVNADIDFICPLIDIIHSKGAKYVRELRQRVVFQENLPKWNYLIKRS